MFKPLGIMKSIVYLFITGIVSALIRFPLGVDAKQIIAILTIILYIYFLYQIIISIFYKIKKAK